MKVFCVKCGTPQEMAMMPAGPVTCPSCGHVFTPVAAPVRPYAGPGAARAGGVSAGVIIAIVAAVGAVPCLGILAAIAIPNFIMFQARSKQSECKSNLKSAYTSEKAYFAEQNAYSTSIKKIGFQPERGNRYAYFLASRGELSQRTGTTEEVDEEHVGVSVDAFKFPQLVTPSFAQIPPLAGDVRAGVTGQCPDCEFTAVCLGNVDNDTSLDVWSISSVDRTGPGGETIVAGQPWNENDDTKN
jgi:type IV pilus assembly protein PilA